MGFEDFFEKCDIFEGLDDTERSLLSELLDRRSYKTDDVLYNEGEAGGTLYYVVGGKVRICRRNNDGELLPYSTVSGGETFGIMSFVDGMEHGAIAIADKDVEVVMLRKERYESLIYKDPTMAAKVYKRIGIHLCDIIRDMNKRYMDLTSYMFT
ncbi:MAG: cyclic nucleotide-binding domain-containing protein [Nitrospirae bacterium]|nr:cyclic nucleotide-binding domain-containing protein [Nitrospirota bacterium]